MPQRYHLYYENPEVFTNVMVMETFIAYFYMNKRNAMKCRYLIIILFHSLTLLVSSLDRASAQPKRLQFTHLKSDDGLSSSIVTSILQDHKGLVWIGTYDGLNRYDGFNFVVYRNNSADSTSLSNNVVRTIIEDHHKNLLIGTQHGLCLYDRNKDRFLNYMLDKSSPLRGIDCIISKIAEDSVDNLWLATDLGLIYFDRGKNQIRRYNNDPTNPESIKTTVCGLPLGKD